MHVSVVACVTEHTGGVRPNHQVERLALSVSHECATNDGVSMKLLPHTANSSIMTVWECPLGWNDHEYAQWHFIGQGIRSCS
jgi:hypothetical protein